MPLRAQLLPTGLLTVPVLAANLLFARDLPPPYQPAVFRADIPALIALPENTLRIAMFALPFFFPFKHTGRGWALYFAGVALYASAWGLQALAPSSALATSALGFSAPAWTAALWLAGIGLLSQPPRFSPRRVWLAAYWLLAGAFLAAHVAHTAVIWSRL